MIKPIIATILVVCLGLALVVPSLFLTRPSLFGAESVSYSDGWKLMMEGAEAQYPISLPYKAKEMKPNHPLKISKVLSSDLEADLSLLIRTSQQEMEVSIEGELVYEYKRSEQSPYTLSPGSAWHVIELPEESSGKELVITLTSPYLRYASEINAIDIGSSRAHMIAMLKDYGLSALIGMLLILLGIFIGATHFVAYRFRHMNKLLLYSAGFSISIGLWILGESRLIQLVYNNPLFMYQVTFLALFLLPIPFCKFIMLAYRPKRGWIINRLYQLHVLFLIVAIVLQLLRLVDLMEMLPLFHILIAISLVTTIVILLIEFRRGLEVKGFLIGVVILLVSSAIDLMAFYITPTRNAAMFTQIGLVLFVIMMMLSSSKYLMELNYAKASNDILLSMAYKDMLTNLFNRTAYEERLNKLASDSGDGEITFVMLDIDGLKEVNDQFGHEEGDLIIKNGAACIEHGFAKLGEIYRIGGDEFIVIMKSVLQTQVDEAVCMMQHLIDGYNEGLPNALLSISHGMAHYDITLGDRQLMNDAIKQADARMYGCKSSKKQQIYVASHRI